MARARKLPPRATRFRPQHAAGHQLQDKLLPADDDGVPGIVPAGVARDHIERAREHIDNLALAFIAPLGAKYDCCSCLHVWDLAHFSSMLWTGGGCAEPRSGSARLCPMPMI